MTITKPEQLQVIFLPFPAKGHSLPMLHFAKQFHSADVMVTFVNSYNHLSSQHFRDLDSTIQIESLGEPEGEECVATARHADELASDAELLIKNIHTRAPLACIVSDMFLGWTQELANKFNIPRYVFFGSPASALATMLHIPELIKQGRIPIDGAKSEEQVCDIPGVPATRLIDLPSPLQDADTYDYEFFVRNCVQMHESAGVLVNTYFQLEANCILALRSSHRMSILPVGPLLPKEYLTTKFETESESCLQWLETQPESSVLYVSFGSMIVLSPAQTHELALGLEASGERFLLVLRNSNAALPEGFEERTKDRGLVHTTWAPQLGILSHRAVKGFLTHCGWNSTLESICRGIPMLTWPISGEQAMNARWIVEDAKCGLEMCKVTDELVTKEHIDKTVREFMEKLRNYTPVWNKAFKLRHMAMDAVCEDGSAKHNLRAFIAELSLGNHRHQSSIGDSFT